ncbi:MAG: hypothetical protein ACREKS_01035 [Candidatus Rokuibacteriota bacterium]
MSAHDHLPVPDLGLTGADANAFYARGQNVLGAEARAALTLRPLPSG